MIVFRGSDKYIVYAKANFSVFDYATFIDLYTPIIGNNATCLYFYLINNIKEENVFDNLFNALGLTPKGINESRNALEAVGLLSTYLSSNNSLNTYSFVLYSSKSPKFFFDDVLLKGLLLKSVGSTKVDSLFNKYSFKKLDKSSLKDITASFNDVYKDMINVDALRLDSTSNELLFDSSSKNIAVVFEEEKFFSDLYEKTKVKKEMISLEELSLIKSLSALYSINEDLMVNVVAETINIYNPIGGKIDQKKLKDKCYSLQAFSYLGSKKSAETKNIDSETLLAEKINLMNKLTPIKYLKLKQNNVNPVKSDANILVNLSHNLNLSDGVINALVDYVLEKNDNVLSGPLAEKIGASLLREGITTAEDAMEYLLRGSRSKKPETFVPSKNSNEINVEDLKELMKEASKK
jgi:replication initiation and membrane attachment protein